MAPGQMRQFGKQYLLYYWGFAYFGGAQVLFGLLDYLLLFSLFLPIFVQNCSILLPDMSAGCTYLLLSTPQSLPMVPYRVPVYYR